MLKPLFFILISFLLTTFCQAEAYKFRYPVPVQPKISIIIDDVGNSLELGQRAVNLKANITLAVLPKTPAAEILAIAGHASGKEIMLHAPMSNFGDFKLGPGALTATQDKETFIRVLNEDIDAIPHVQGVNNHMGSMLTTQSKQMQWLMSVLKQRDLYFIDSLTNGGSVALRTARNNGITTQERDVFLDHDRNTQAIEAAFHKLIRVAEQNGFAIGIGHPYPETLAVLERLLPLIGEHNIELVPISKLLNINDKELVSGKSATKKDSIKPLL